MVFCNEDDIKFIKTVEEVTILILIDGFLQLSDDIGYGFIKTSHNPYFNRWFSAIGGDKELLIKLLKSQSLF